MIHPHEQEEIDAWFARNDRFDGFDRGDLDFPQAEDYGDEEDDGPRPPREGESLCLAPVIDN